MKIFHCDNCDQLVFFENTKCVSCGHLLAFLPECADMASLVPDDAGGYRRAGSKSNSPRYKLCSNYETHEVCNWAVPFDSPSTLCRSCDLTRTIPDLSAPGARDSWARLEAAKRRLVYTLDILKLPVESKTANPDRGLTFEFLADSDDPEAPPILTGHADGVITINIAESDDVEREKRKSQFQETYRTVLGHFRHEIGHYYWDRLVRDSEALEPFRELFGDDRADYAGALQKHHTNGAPADWNTSFVSAYASAHPWEDWAETWAHYMHIIDTLETADASGLALRPRRGDEPSLKPDPKAVGRQPRSFDTMIKRWFSLTYVLNNLNRGMGLPDAYPFVLSTAAVEKLRFVHDVIEAGDRTESLAPAAAQA